MTFYTYFWLRENGTPYYVGKGTGDRAFTSRGHRVKRPKHTSRILVQYWESECEAFQMEKWWIQLFGRKNLNTGILRNRTNGGDGPSGMVFTEASRLKISNSLLGNKRRLGIPHTKETLEKIGNKSRGRKPSEETLRKRSISLKNVGPYSKERIAKAGLRSGLSRIGKKTGKRIAKEYEE